MGRTLSASTWGVDGAEIGDVVRDWWKDKERDDEAGRGAKNDVPDVNSMAVDSSRDSLDAFRFLPRPKHSIQKGRGYQVFVIYRNFGISYYNCSSSTADRINKRSQQLTARKGILRSQGISGELDIDWMLIPERPRVACRLNTFQGVMSQPAVAQQRLEQNTISVLPIDCLPTEILVTIFEESIYTPELAFSEIPHIQKLHRLARVCPRWNKVIEETSSFWTVLESNAPKELIPYILQRSRQSPLVIKCCFVADRRANSVFSKANLEGLWNNIKSFLMMTFVEIHRWRSALIRLSHGDADIVEGLGKHAPLIEMVDIDIQECPQQPNVNLFAGSASNLQSVRLAGLPFTWSQGQFRGLQHLDISATPSSQPALEYILITIGSSPRLRTLCLESLRMPVAQEEANLPTVSVNCLETLSLCEVSPSVIEAILIHIQAPVLQHLTISPGRDDGGTGSGQFIDRIPHFLPMIHSIINRARAVDLFLRRTSANIRTPVSHPEPRPQIDISIDHNSSAHTLQIFLRNILCGPGSPTPIRLHITQVPEVEWSNLSGMLSSLDGVAELSMEDLPGEYQRDLFRFLSTPSDAGGRQKWPFPNLQQLFIPSNASVERVMELVKARYGSDISGNPAGGRDEGMPYSLTRLDVGKIHLTAEQFREIRKIVNRAVIPWKSYSQVLNS